jgi:hypothetical protein
LFDKILYAVGKEQIRQPTSYLHFISPTVSSQRKFVPVYLDLSSALDLASRVIELTRIVLLDRLTPTQIGFVFTSLIGK